MSRLLPVVHAAAMFCPIVVSDRAVGVYRLARANAAIASASLSSVSVSLRPSVTIQPSTPLSAVRN